MRYLFLLLFTLALMPLFGQNTQIERFYKDLGALKQAHYSLFFDTYTEEQLLANTVSIHRKVGDLESDINRFVKANNYYTPSSASLLKEVSEFESFTESGGNCECRDYFEFFIKQYQGTKQLVTSKDGYYIYASTIGNFTIYYIYSSHQLSSMVKMEYSTGDQYSYATYVKTIGLWYETEIIKIIPKNTTLKNIILTSDIQPNSQIGMDRCKP